MTGVKTEAVRLDEEEFLGSSVAGLRNNLATHGIDVSDYPVSRTRIYQMRDYAIDTVYKEFKRHHAECKGGDFCSEHPHQTEADYLEHEANR